MTAFKFFFSSFLKVIVFFSPVLLPCIVILFIYFIKKFINSR